MDIVLQGTVDDACSLSILRANNLVLNKISDIIDDEYDKHIDTVSVAYKTGVATFLLNDKAPLLHTEWEFKFPEFSNINVNMMPFKIFKAKETLPEYLHGYLKIIKSCPIYQFDCSLPDGKYTPDKICYLTIHESIVKKGETQRRPGTHIERPGSISSLNGGRFLAKQPFGDNEYSSIYWGMGGWVPRNCGGYPVDGIYMATNTANSCKIYDVLIDKPEEITDKHGGLDYVLSSKIKNKGYFMEPDQLYWMTDRTPHESEPVDEDCKRQFFRLVVGKISVWYSQHNTANPMVEPDAPIINESKF